MMVGFNLCEFVGSVMSEGGVRLIGYNQAGLGVLIALCKYFGDETRYYCTLRL